jgi:non-ribosomal peptide synthetase component F
MREQLGLSDQDTLLHLASLSFDISVLEIFLPFTTGARVVVISREVAADGSRLMKNLSILRCYGHACYPSNLAFAFASWVARR